MHYDDYTMTLNLVQEQYFDDSLMDYSNFYPDTNDVLTDLNDTTPVLSVTSGGDKDTKPPATINEAFDQLRDVVPSFPYERRISKIETLRLAISYIELLVDTLNQKSERPIEYLARCARGEIKEDKGWKTTDLTTRLQWIKWE